MLYQSETIQLYWLEEGIAELLFQAPGTVNKLDTVTMLSLDNALSVLEKQSALQGVILRSAKTSFIVGADITEFLALFAAPENQLLDWLNFANTLFNRLEDLPVPTLSAINGHALGGGCECVLATDFRIATTDAQLGLPETKLGIMPGFGGTVRLPRLLGPDNALELIAPGKILSATEALRLGLVDAVVTDGTLQTAALVTLKQALNQQLDWQKKRQPKLNPLRLNSIEASMSFTTARAVVQQSAKSHFYPAPITAVNVIEKSTKLARNEAQQIESSHFISLARSKEAKTLVGIFLNEQYVKNLAKQKLKRAEPPQNIMVLGAGIMGGGIAYQSAYQGLSVVMKDINQSALSLGLNEAANLLTTQLTKRKIDAQRLTQVLNSIHPTLHYENSEPVDLVIEAVVENPKIKANVLAEVETHVTEETILASNTSSIPISSLAETLTRPHNFCGIHFFNPVHRMPLVEVVRGKKTSDSTLSRAIHYVTLLGKTPIVVNDCPGFFVNRVLFPYFAGFNLLLKDGVNFQRVDKVMENQFGWPMGPAYLLDVVGIDTAHHAQEVMAQGFPDRMGKSYRNALDILFEQQRYGQKNGYGFYRYQQDHAGKVQKLLDPTIGTLLPSNIADNHTISDEDIILRMMIPMLNEAIRCLDEGIIASPAEADMALIYGLGFPPFHGGAFRYLDLLGTAHYLKLTERYHELGMLYQAPAGLIAKAKHNESYYPAPKPISITVTK